jgi:hypothetical protein
MNIARGISNRLAWYVIVASMSAVFMHVDGLCMQQQHTNHSAIDWAYSNT